LNAAHECHVASQDLIIVTMQLLSRYYYEGDVKRVDAEVGFCVPRNSGKATAILRAYRFHIKHNKVAFTLTI
jgi:hypothetical protein